MHLCSSAPPYRYYEEVEHHGDAEEDQAVYDERVFDEADQTTEELLLRLEVCKSEFGRLKEVLVARFAGNQKQGGVNNKARIELRMVEGGNGKSSYNGGGSGSWDAGINASNDNGKKGKSKSWSSGGDGGWPNKRQRVIRARV